MRAGYGIWLYQFLIIAYLFYFSNSLSAQKIKEYFKSINDSGTPYYQADVDILQFNDRFLKSDVQIMFAELDEQISEQEIVNAIKKLHSAKIDY